MLASLARGLLDLLAPPTCPGCGLPQPADSSPPAKLLAGTPQPFCDACWPLTELPPLELRPPARVAAAVQYQGPVADAIRRFKYASASEATVPLAQLLVTAAQPYAGTVDVVVPMPLHADKLRARGYNPSALLARPVARALGLPLRVDWLLRRRATRNQAGLSREARLHNVRGAFSAKPVHPRRVLLIDDVVTTGATLEAAANTLRDRAHEVTCLALAWAPLPASS